MHNGVSRHWSISFQPIVNKEISRLFSLAKTGDYFPKCLARLRVLVLHAPVRREHLDRRFIRPSRPQQAADDGEIRSKRLGDFDLFIERRHACPGVKDVRYTSRSKQLEIRWL